MENQKNTKLETIRNVICAVSIMLAIFLLFKRCDSNQSTIQTKPINGNLKVAKPEQIIIHDTIDLTQPQKLFDKDPDKAFYLAEIDRLLKENQSLDAAFAYANDSLQQVIYRNAIGIKAFSHTWDNDTITATAKGLVRGEVQSISLNYTVKPKTVKVPQTVFRLLGNLETGMTKDLSKFNAKAGLGVQTKNGSIISLAADTDQRFYLGYSFSIFSIKR